MHLPTNLFFVLLPFLFSSTRAHNIQLGAHSRECFHESLHKDDKMTVTYQVGDREFGGSGSLEIDFWVRLLLLLLLIIKTIFGQDTISNNVDVKEGME